MTKQTTVTLSADGKTYIHTKAVWSNEYPIEQLEHWLAFYRRQRSIFPKAGGNYDSDIEALEGLMRQLGRDT